MCEAMSRVTATESELHPSLVVTLSKFLNLPEMVSSPIKWERISSTSRAYCEDYIM